MKKRLAVLAALIAVFLWLRYAVLAEYLTFESARESGELARAFAERHFALTSTLFLVLYIAMGFLLPGMIALTIMGGFVFGTTLGTGISLAGAVSGASLAFWFARAFAGKRLQKAYARELKTFNAEFEKSGFFYLFTLRVLPVFPSFMVNFFAGFTRVPFMVFFWSTLLGSAPGAAVYAFAGSRLGVKGLSAEVYAVRVIAVFSLITVLMLVPAAYRRFKGRGDRRGL